MDSSETQSQRFGSELSSVVDQSEIVKGLIAWGGFWSVCRLPDAPSVKSLPFLARRARWLHGYFL